MISPKNGEIYNVNNTQYNHYYPYYNTFYQSKILILIFNIIGENNNIFSENNPNYISILRNLIYIYSNYLTRKKKYYFLKYYTKAVKYQRLKLCTCQYSTYENDLEPLYTSYPKTNRHFNFSTSTDYLKLNKNKINKISNFIINKENSNIYSNFINLNKSEYFYNGNEMGSFSSYNINNQNPTKNIISVKNGINNKKYVVKIKLYGNQIESSETENNSIKYKKYMNNNTKPKKYLKNIYSYKTGGNKNLHSNYYHLNKTRKFQGLLTDRIYTKDYVQTLNPINRNKVRSIETNNKIMNDQEILDYLNTNNTEKKNLIKKILKQKLNDINIIPNKKKIQLNTCKSYSYINNNYNYNYNYYNDRQTTPFNTNINIPIKKKRNNITYQYFDNENVDNMGVINKDKENNERIIINKKHSLRPCCSNEVIFYRNYKNFKEEEKNYFSTNNNNYNNNTNNTNRSKKLKKMNSLNNLENINKIDNINNIPNISETSSFPNKTKNILSPTPRIIVLNQKNKLKNSESTTKLITRKKQIYPNNINHATKNIVQKKEIPKKSKIKIPKNTYHIKANSLDNNIKENKKNNLLVNNVVNEQYNKENNNNKKDVSISESDNLEISVQSMNDSKIMELARNYIKQEDNLNRNEINQILNSKKNFV